MKITALLAAAALVGGTASAGQNDNASTTKPAARQSTTAPADGATHEGIGVKTKRALGKIGDKMRSAGNKLAHATHTDKQAGTTRRSDESRAGSDTRTMGAAGSDTGSDSGRRQRMDNAYDNWKSGNKR